MTQSQRSMFRNHAAQRGRLKRPAERQSRRSLAVRGMCHYRKGRAMWPLLEMFALTIFGFGSILLFIRISINA